MTECALKQQMRKKGYLMKSDGRGYMVIDVIADKVLLGGWPNEYGASFEEVAKLFERIG